MDGQPGDAASGASSPASAATDDLPTRAAALLAVIRRGAIDGDAEAQAVWGQHLLDRGESRAALGWFMRAAAQQHAMALNMVGRCYDLGWGTPPDKHRAAECYRAAALRGLDWAMYNYATLLALGEGVAEDKAAALGWLERAVALGGDARAKAANFVGSFAEDGWAGPRDMTRAVACYAAAAAGGDFRGCFNHARMRVAAGDGEGALAWLRRAGDLGHDRFVAQMRDWLARTPDAAWRARAIAARGRGGGRGRGGAGGDVLIAIPDLLDVATLARVRALIDGAGWIDGNATSGTQSALAKNNVQLPEESEAARAAGALVLDALAGSALFVAAALPLKVFPPLFNRYAGGQSFGAHVDAAIRIRRGSDFRVRSDLSATLFLDDPATYDGGELVIEGQFGEQRVKLPEGHMVLYPASSLHHVTPVTRGVRTASFFWVQSMVRDDTARRLLFELDQGVQSVAGAMGQGDPATVRLTGVYHNLIRRWADSG